MVLPDDSWVRQGSCAGTGNPEAWHPGYTALPESLDVIKVCRTCPVRRECLDFAMADRRLPGVWGGTTTMQRQQIRRAAGDASDHHALYDLMVEQEADASPPWDASDTTEAILLRRTAIVGNPWLARRARVRKPTLT